MNRLTSLEINDKVSLKNRVIVPAMASETAKSSGEVSENTLNHYSHLAKSGASLIIVEYSYVHDSGKSEEYQLGIHSDEMIFGLKKLSKRLKKVGVLSGIQLTHACGKVPNEMSTGRLIAPSEIQVPVKDLIMKIPQSMSTEEIEEFKMWFFKAAERATKSGFDLVELHAAHGYGLNQFLSPFTNKRTDQYGGKIINRARVITDLILKIKKEIPALIVSVRIPGEDGVENGLNIHDGVEISKILKEAGADLISVSSGIGGWRRPLNREGEGYLVREAKIIQESLGDFPIIGVGGLKTGLAIDEFLNNKSFSLAAVGRAILKDPVQWRVQQMRK